MRKLLVGCCALVALGATGCGSAGFSGLYNVPLPGGAPLGNHPYSVTAQFADVLDLVPQAAVKVNDVAVGRVESISLPPNGWTANVTLEINGDVHLPGNAVAWLQQSSLLGEKYIELSAPVTGTPQGTLRNGAVIPLTRTNRDPEVEEVFGALSMVLNGGGINQLHTITGQLNNALNGNEPEIRAMLTNVDALIANLDDHRQDITNAIDGINRFAASLAGRDQQIGNLLDNVTPGLRVLDQQRDQLVSMLNALDQLSSTAVDTINRSQADLVADLKALAPTLQQLNNAGQALPQALQTLLTYPFTDAVLNGIKGDYLNTYVSIVAAPGTVITPPLPSTASAPMLPLPSVTPTPAPGGNGS